MLYTINIIPNNKHFLCKDLLNIIFVLYEILKLRAYLFELLDKNPCDATDLRTKRLFVLYPWMTWIMISRILDNSKIHSITQIRGHPSMTSTQNDQFCYPYLHRLQKSTIDQLLKKKKKNLQTRGNFQQSPTHLLYRRHKCMFPYSDHSFPIFFVIDIFPLKLIVN